MTVLSDLQKQVYDLQVRANQLNADLYAAQNAPPGYRPVDTKFWTSQLENINDEISRLNIQMQIVGQSPPELQEQALQQAQAYTYARQVGQYQQRKATEEERLAERLAIEAKRQFMASPGSITGTQQELWAGLSAIKSEPYTVEFKRQADLWKGLQTPTFIPPPELAEKPKPSVYGKIKQWFETPRGHEIPFTFQLNKPEYYTGEKFSIPFFHKWVGAKVSPIIIGIEKKYKVPIILGAEPTEKQRKTAETTRKWLEPVVSFAPVWAFFSPAISTGTAQASEYVYDYKKLKFIKKTEAAPLEDYIRVFENAYNKKGNAGVIELIRKYNERIKVQPDKELAVRNIQLIMEDLYRKGIVKGYIINPATGTVKIISEAAAIESFFIGGIKPADIYTPAASIFFGMPKPTPVKVPAVSGFESFILSTPEKPAQKTKEKEKQVPKYIVSTITGTTTRQVPRFVPATITGTTLRLVPRQVPVTVTETITRLVPRQIPRISFPQPFPTPSPRYLKPKLPKVPPVIFPFPIIKYQQEQRKRKSDYEKQIAKQRRAYQASVGAVSLGLVISKKQARKLQKKFTGGEIRPMIAGNYNKKLNKLLIGR